MPEPVAPEPEPQEPALAEGPSCMAAEHLVPAATHEEHCGYIAVLPASPATPPQQLEALCRAMAAPAVSLRWLDARVAELEHPQLPEPLQYIEITCGVTLATAALPDGQREAAALSVLQQICDALMADGGLIGNAELVHSVRCPMPLLPSALPCVTVGEGSQWWAEGKAAFQRFGLLGIRAALPAEVLTGVKDGVVAQFVRSQATKTSTVAL